MGISHVKLKDIWSSLSSTEQTNNKLEYLIGQMSNSIVGPAHNKSAISV